MEGVHVDFSKYWKQNKERKGKQVGVSTLDGICQKMQLVIKKTAGYSIIQWHYGCPTGSY